MNTGHLGTPWLLALLLEANHKRSLHCLPLVQWRMEEHAAYNGEPRSRKCFPTSVFMKESVASFFGFLKAADSPDATLT